MSRKQNRGPMSTNGRIATGPSDTGSEGRRTVDPSDRLALSRLDWAAAGLVCAVLLISPIWLGAFATPAPQSFLSAAFEDQGLVSHAMEVFAGPLVLLLTATAVLLLAWREFKRPVAIGAVPGLAPAFCIVAAWAVLSAIHNPAAYLSVNSLTFLFCALLVGALVSRLGRDSSCIAALVVAIALAGTIIAAIGVREYLEEWKNGVVDHRTFSTFGPNFLAGYLLLTLPVTAAAFAAATGRSPRLLLGVGLALQSGCIFLTGSRAGTAIALIAVLLWATTAVFIGADRARRRWLVAGAAIFVIGSGVSATPTLSRLINNRPGPQKTHQAGSNGTDDTQSHSGEFRKRTWMGTVRMATRNPWLGTGVGTYAIDSPRYSDTAFTAHAHNSFLQWMGETGFPGAVALLTAFAAASAFVVHILLLIRSRRKELIVVTSGSVRPGLFEAPGLLQAGFVAGLVASTLHNLFDSDLYIVATLITFSSVFGLAIAQARALAPLATRTPRPVSGGVWIVAALMCLFLVVRAAQTGTSRWQREQVARSQNGSEAIAAARAAAEADPIDPEPHIALGQLEGRNASAEHEFLEAARVAPMGRTLYLLGRYYKENGRLKSAIDALDRARTLDPHNLQTLRALAEVERQVGQSEAARITYQAMAALETGAFGTIRAMPELVEADFAYAHAGLAEIAVDSKRPDLAEREYALAAGVLKRYWQTRNWQVNLSRPPEKRKALAKLYTDVLQARIDKLNELGRGAETPRVETELQQARTDIEEDEKKSAVP